MDSAKKMGFYPYRPSTVLSVSGDDAASFLQGQFTNELRGINERKAVYGLWLNQKGKVLADSFVMGFGSDGKFLVMSYFSNPRTILGRLEAYVIADDVEIKDVTAAWAGVAVLGKEAEIEFARPSPDGHVFNGRRDGVRNIEWIFPFEKQQEVREKLSSAGRSELSWAEMERSRILAGIPAIPQDIGANELPNEGGLENEGISYTKGCYLGQEVMARLKSMGQVRRRLLRVKGSVESLPSLPAPLFAGERKVGELRSAILDGQNRFLGLALLSLLHVTPASGLAFSPGGVAAVTVMDLS